MLNLADPLPELRSVSMCHIIPSISSPFLSSLSNGLCRRKPLLLFPLRKGDVGIGRRLANLVLPSGVAVWVGDVGGTVERQGWGTACEQPQHSRFLRVGEVESLALEAGIDDIVLPVVGLPLGVSVKWNAVDVGGVAVGPEDFKRDEGDVVVVGLALGEALDVVGAGRGRVWGRWGRDGRAGHQGESRRDDEGLHCGLKVGDLT